MGRAGWQGTWPTFSSHKGMLSPAVLLPFRLLEWKSRGGKREKRDGTRVHGGLSAGRHRTGRAAGCRSHGSENQAWKGAKSSF